MRDARGLLRIALMWEDAARFRVSLELFERTGRRILSRNDAELRCVVELFREDLQGLAPIWSELGIVAAQIVDG